MNVKIQAKTETTIDITLSFRLVAISHTTKESSAACANIAGNTRNGSEYHMIKMLLSLIAKLC